MGKVEIDHTGSGSGITLSSDGTSLLLDGTAIGGGGGADLYAENYTSGTKPTATGTNAVAIGENSQASGAGAVAMGYESAATQSYSFAAAISGGLSYAGARASNSIAMGYRSTTNNLGSVAIGYTASTSGNYSIALGNSAITGGTDAIALGKSRAGGTGSFAAAIANNTGGYGAIGTGSVAIGYQNKATGAYSFAAGEDSSIASGYGSVAIGKSCTASGDRGVAIGTSSTAGSAVNSRTNVAMGTSCNASGGSAFAFGERADTRGLYGKYAFGSGYGGGTGAAQTGVMVLGADTTDATATALCVNFGSFTPNSTNQVILPNNSAYAFHGTIVARQQAAGGTACAAWKIEGLIRREGTAGTTVLVNSATTVLDNTPSWGLALSADTTNGGLKIEVTGAAATNIRWVATIHTSEVTYA